MKRSKLYIYAATLWALTGGLYAGQAIAAPSLDPIILQQETIVENFPEQEVGNASVRVFSGKRKTINVPVKSWRDIPFQTVKRQALDYSCGSAAVSTLLTYVYDHKTSEGDIFKAMFKAGNQEKIKKEGFSLLDMSNFLNKKGFKAIGYRVKLDVIESKKVPFIALINNKGYNHFVVVKSISGPYVLVGDPSKGNKIFKRAAFNKMWNGIALIVTNHAKKARSHFKNKKEWTYARALALPSEGNQMGVDRAALTPIPWQVAPSGIDVLNTALTSTTSVFQ